MNQATSVSLSSLKGLRTWVNIRPSAFHIILAISQASRPHWQSMNRKLTCITPEIGNYLLIIALLGVYAVYGLSTAFVDCADKLF